ncbi:MAG: SDR family NAD(P)-dependent oxidoreductase [Planktomarina sp.]|jgi:NAD(P)-dependent dehydrogenase (short-subunit alcohol dehydrogenase family)|nr:SDR family NAD(P)-dependent oxidoreductase [Planktomarina sp.]
MPKLKEISLEFQDKIVILTGAAGGIGTALAREFAGRGARLALCDLNAAALEALAGELGALHMVCDVTVESHIQALVAEVEARLGPVDIFFSNAGFSSGEPDHAASAPDRIWQASWEVHVMAHVYACRALLPAMRARGQGYLVQMASAAGLLNQIGDAAYSTSKHAAVGFAEALAISHGHEGLKVSVVCPQYVATPMLGYDDPAAAAPVPGLLSPEVTAQRVAEAMEEERFLILPHPEVADYMVFKAKEPDKWLAAMRKLRARLVAKLGRLDLAQMHKWM